MQFHVSKHKALADKIEQLVTNIESLFDLGHELVETLARKFSKDLINRGIFPSRKLESPLSKEVKKTF